MSSDLNSILSDRERENLQKVQTQLKITKANAAVTNIQKKWLEDEAASKAKLVEEAKERKQTDAEKKTAAFMAQLERENRLKETHAEREQRKREREEAKKRDEEERLAAEAALQKRREEADADAQRKKKDLERLARIEEDRLRSENVNISCVYLQFFN